MPRPTGILRICKQCRDTFLIWPSDLKYSKGEFCSNQCSTKARLVPIGERIWPKVEKTETCWLWTKTRTDFGYGAIRINKFLYMVHRVVWEITYGPIPKSMQVLHKCDIPACVRPDHLFLGTQADNMKDMAIKGRGSALKGANHKDAKLTEAKVFEIRSLQGKLASRKVGAMFGISSMHVCNIWNRKKWKHLP